MQFCLKLRLHLAHVMRPAQQCRCFGGVKGRGKSRRSRRNCGRMILKQFPIR